MANYYSYNTAGRGQSFGVSNTSYGSNSYSIQPSQPQQPPQQQQQQASSYIAPTHQVQQQPQTAYVTYGHQQQASYSSSVSQTPRYYQQSSSSTNNGSATSYYSTTHTQIKNEQPAPTQIYATSTGASYNQQQSLRNVKQVSISSSTRVQPVSRINYLGSKPVQNSSAAVVSKPAAKSTSDYGGHQSNASISNYEKALISAASSIYQQQHKGGGGGGRSSYTSINTKSMPLWKQKRIQDKMNRDPNKAIVASEVKAYLYAWLGKVRTRPEYNITAHGNSPYHQTYVCELVAPGISYVGKGAAGNKKDAQTRAAWDFCDYLLKEGRMKDSELPTRESKFAAANNKLPASYKEKDSKQVTETIAKKKLVTNKINFVGGQSLNLSAADATDQPSTVTTTMVSYPTVTVDSTPSVASSTTGSIPTQVVNVKTNTAADAPKALSANDVDVSGSKNSPIGESYVEQVWTDGRVIRFRCKLCECEFNDPSGRELHVRGRRHRLSYKKKVDPSIEVEVKLNPQQRGVMMWKLRNEAKKEAMRQQRHEREMWQAQMQRQQQEEIRLYEEDIWHQYQSSLLLYEEEIEFHRRRNLTPPAHLLPPQPPALKFFQPHAQMKSQQMKTLDDQHVTSKHAMIYPTNDELTAVQKAVQLAEAALKDVSGVIHEQELKVYMASVNQNSQKKPKPQERLLKAVLRIGALAKGLLLKGNLNVELVLMCNMKPTKGMVGRVAEHLPGCLKKDPSVDFSITTMVEECSLILVTTTEPVVTIKVILTATQMRPLPPVTGGATEGAEKPDPPDILDRQKCCRALAALRHAKWFQAKANGLQSCVPVTRVMKDLCKRVPTWAPLSDWAVELLVERVVSSAKLPMSPSAALQRVFEAIGLGVLLPGGPGLLDPCERDPTDAASALANQEREDITASAQQALRLIAYRDIHKVLGIERIAETTGSGRKRPNEGGNESGKKMIKQEIPKK